MKILHTLLLNAVATTIASAGVIDHFNAGSGAPGSQGWTPNSGILSGATATDLGQTVWQMTGNNCCGYWSSSLTAQQWTDAFTYGWSLSGTVRVASGAGFGYLVLDVPSSFPRYDISFGVDNGNAWAGLSAWVDAANPALKYTFSDNALHLIDMRYDPLTQTAGLWADGVQVLSGYTGHSLFRENHGPLFGVAGNTTVASFASVTFTINDPSGNGAVPEPGTLGLIAIGAGLCLLRLRRQI